MKVAIKDFSLKSLDIGSKGIEIDISENKKDNKSHCHHDETNLV